MLQALPQNAPSNLQSTTVLDSMQYTWQPGSSYVVCLSLTKPGELL